MLWLLSIAATFTDLHKSKMKSYSQDLTKSSTKLDTVNFMEFNGIYKQSKSFQSEALTVETDYEKPPITGTKRSIK